MEQEKRYKDMQVRFYQEDLPAILSANLMANLKTKDDWEFKIWNHKDCQFVYTGDLQETIELILLGKICKAQQVEELAKAIG